MNRSHLRLLLLSAPFFLGACGEGWELQKVDHKFPYGKRTAGSGVAYVRAHMMPEKDLNVAPVMEDKAVEAAPVLDADEIFVEAQEKGAVPVHKKAETPAETELPVHTENHAAEQHDAPAHAEAPAPAADNTLSEQDMIDPYHEEVEQGDGGTTDHLDDSAHEADENAHDTEHHDTEHDEHSSRDAPAEEPVQKAFAAPKTLSAEEYIPPSPEDIELAEEVQPASGLTAASRALAAQDAEEDISGHDKTQAHDAYVFKEKVEEPAGDTVVAPKNDFLEFISEGEDNLEKIYTDPLAEE